MMHYTDCEVAFLEANYRRMGAAWCAEKLGRKVTSIYTKAHYMGLPAGSRWTPEEREFMEAHYPEMGEQWCADKLGRTRNAVRNKAYEWDLQRG